MTTTPDNMQNEEYSACANPRCNCSVNNGEKFCCEYCARKENSEVCQCGHTECQAEQIKKFKLNLTGWSRYQTITYYLL